MPKFIEAQIRKEAAKKGKTGRAADRYVYGAMNNMGAMHGNKETAKGRAMQEKHDSGKSMPMMPSRKRGKRHDDSENKGF